MNLDNRKTILLVEDQVIIAMGEKTLLERYGYKVLLAHSNKSAIELCRNNSAIDLVLLDIDLGRGKDSTETATIILKERKIPIVFLSSHTEPEIVSKTEGINFYGYVTKESGITVLDASIKVAFRLFEAQNKLNTELAEHLLLEEALNKSDKMLLQQNTILKLINQIHNEAIKCETLEELGKACLNIIETVTESKISFVGEMGSDGLHHEIAVSETGMECCAMNDKTGHRRPPGKFKLLGLSGIPLLEGKSVLTNDPSNHPQSAGLPEGHTKINSFLGVPFVTNGKTVGMIAVANREGGYRPEDQMILEALAPTILQEILRKRAEMAFKENQEILKTIIESTTDFISLKDADGKYLVLNSTAESILKNASGFSRAEIIGKRDADLLLPEFTIMENRADSRVMNTGTTQIYDNTFKFDLREITYSIIKSPCFDDKGKISGIVTIARDISTKKRDDEKIKSLLREKELLLKEVHHRIKNNMNTINALLLMHADDIEDIVANNALKEAGSLVKSMMILYEKLYSSPNYENLRVKEYLTALIDEVIGIFPKGKTVKVEKRIDDFILEAKKLQPISIIINELITNIMKYSFVNREEGKIFISLTNNENKVNLIIQDNGIGMPEFIDFEQSPGFGLTLVKILTEQISGKIWIERQNGTAVILEFEI